MEANNGYNNKIQEIPFKALYLGLLIKEPKEKIMELIVFSLSNISDEYPNIEDCENLKEGLAEINNFKNFKFYNNPWRFPKENEEWHITTLFKKKRFDKSHPAYESFIDKKEVFTDIKAVVYVPKKIFTLIVFPDTPVENEFPHITTLLGSWKAYYSNDICKELFGKNKPLEKEYKILKNNEKELSSSVHKFEINLFDKKETVYFFIFPNSIIYKCEMHVFFN